MMENLRVVVVGSMQSGIQMLYQRVLQRINRFKRMEVGEKECGTGRTDGKEGFSCLDEEVKAKRSGRLP
jgi:hypothetical protein